MTEDLHQHEVERLHAAWMSGGPARALIEELIRLKRMDEAGSLAWLTLEYDCCEDREAFKELLERAGSPPPGWIDAVIEFSLHPTIECWDALMSFTPCEVLYQRTRNTLRTLRRLGVDANVLFRCATRNGTVPDAFELVQSGDVDPETVIERAQEAPLRARAMWFGLAAEAAFARGDEVGTVRLLKMAYSVTNEGFGPDVSVMAIRDRASDELGTILDKVGILQMSKEGGAG